jgi:hypothetical protein
VQDARADVLDRLVVARLDLGSQGYDSTAAALFSSTLLARLQNDSRLAGVGIATSELFGGESVSVAPVADGSPVSRMVSSSRVTPGWFDAMNLRPLAGRRLIAGDPPTVAVVNETLARMLKPDGSAVGMTMAVRRFLPKPALPSVFVRDPRVVQTEIVGVVPDSVRRPDRPLRPIASAYFALNAEVDVPTTFTLFARTDRPDEIAPELSNLMTSLEGRAPWGRVETAAAVFASEASPTRSLAGWIGATGLVALGLASARFWRTPCRFGRGRSASASRSAPHRDVSHGSCSGRPYD